MNKREYIATRAAKELKNGDVVNLGIGLPTMVADFVPEKINIFLHSENGILGVGPTPSENEIEPDLVNADKLPVTVLEGASFFDSPTSFGMIRGNHVDVAILGVLQVDSRGVIANWAIPGKSILGVGGAMDLLEGAKKIIVTTRHVTRNNESKIVQELAYPKTSRRKVDIVITDLAVFKVDIDGLLLTEIAPDSSLSEVKEKTDASFRVAERLKRKE